MLFQLTNQGWAIVGSFPPTTFIFFYHSLSSQLTPHPPRSLTASTQRPQMLSRTCLRSLRRLDTPQAAGKTAKVRCCPRVPDRSFSLVTISMGQACSHGPHSDSSRHLPLALPQRNGGLRPRRLQRLWQQLALADGTFMHSQMHTP